MSPSIILPTFQHFFVSPVDTIPSPPQEHHPPLDCSTFTFCLNPRTSPWAIFQTPFNWFCFDTIAWLWSLSQTTPPLDHTLLFFQIYTRSATREVYKFCRLCIMKRTMYPPFFYLPPILLFSQFLIGLNSPPPTPPSFCPDSVALSLLVLGDDMTQFSPFTNLF